MEINVPQCMMTDAVELSPIAYWAQAKAIKRGKDGYVTSFEVRDAGYEGEREHDKWVKVNETAIREATKKLLNGEVEVSRSIAAQFVGKEWDYDSDGVDVVIQTIAFGKIVYG